MKWLCIAGLMSCLMIAGAACSSGPAPVLPISAYYTEAYDLPQTRSAGDLAAYMSSEHLEYHLDGWFFFGSLVDSASPDSPAAFIISMQRIAQEFGGLVWQTVPAIVAYNDPSTEGYVFGGVYSLDIDPLVIVTSDPWTVVINSLEQEDPVMTMGLISGTMGEAGAVYRLTANLQDQRGGRLEAEILLRDRLGAVNQGYGSASFFPQYLSQYQRLWVTKAYGSSVERYLEGTGDPMAGQGSFYYSLPLMDVEEFWVRRDGELLSSGTGGTMWMDDIVQTYTDEAKAVLIGNATWEFYSIMLPEEDAAIMVIQIKSGTGTLPVATLFSGSSERTRNLARKAVHSWDIDEISVEVVPEAGIWTSTATGLPYAQEHRIKLSSEDRTADLTVRMVRKEQEILIDLRKWDLGETIKYEGLATVTGTLDGRPVEGTAIVEVQPYGHQ